MYGLATQIQSVVKTQERSIKGRPFSCCRLRQGCPSSSKRRRDIRFRVVVPFKNQQPQEHHMKNQTYDRITDRITALLEQGTVPWHKPWKARTGLPRNFVSQIREHR